MNELLIPTQIIQSKRKSISLIIKNNGDFIVRTPLGLSKKEILKFINKKSSWIIKKRTEQKENSIKPLDFNSSTIFLMGKLYKFNFHNKTRVALKDSYILLPKENSKERFVSFLKKTAKNYLEDRAKLIASLFNFSYSTISISSAKTCWGSCSVKNKLHFTYKLIFCPLDVIDYVVLHELCHTKVKNHSANFWALVEKCNPYYKTHENWLKKNRGIIDVI